MIPDDQWKLDYEEHLDKWISYLKDIYPYFRLCKDKSVLEIAPFRGVHTQIIESSGAKDITLVELNPVGLEGLRLHYPHHTIVDDDIFNYLQTKRKFDVVVCCGLLYHLHSPLYLLELIRNMADPEFLYIETYLAPDKITFKEEPDNYMGMRQTLSTNYKSTRLSVSLTREVFLTATLNLGYELIKETDHFDKPTGSVNLWIFKKI